MKLDIIYQDKFLVAVNKPHGLLVHRTRIAADVDIFALQLLRDQIAMKVYPLHRIDRKTGGVLLFGLSEEMDRLMQTAFAERRITKKYIAIVRGYTDNHGIIDYPLKKSNGNTQEAITNYKTIDRTELPIPLGQHNTSRYSLVEIAPTTGRFHQIRRHFKHINHPIICDRPHGCIKQNKMFQEKFDLTTMMLHAKEISFNHPMTNEIINIKADIQSEFKRMIEELKLIPNNRGFQK